MDPPNGDRLDACTGRAEALTMGASLLDPQAIQEVVKAAMSRAKEAFELAAKANQRLDDLENSHARTIESVKEIFSAAVHENSKEQAAALTKLSAESKSQSTSIVALIEALKNQEAGRARELRTNRALFVVLAVILTAFVEYCRHS
jgi:hypothetical protein